MEEIKWWIAFEELSQCLKEHFRIHRKDAGISLWQLLVKNEDFRNNNDWALKFQDESGVNSFDPVHIFASINGNKTSDQLRTRRINIILKTLKSQETFNDIDYTGCPAIVNISILSVRNISSQNEIWRTFDRIHNKGFRGLLKADFNKFQNWHGLNFSSFTIFLYWIKSEHFLPIDKNTRTFLITSRLIIKEPNKFEDYVNLVNNLSVYNYLQNPKYGESGLYREITHISYLVFNLGQRNIIQSTDFKKLLEDFKTTSIDGLEIDQKHMPDDRHSGFLEDIAKYSDIGCKVIALETLSECDDVHLNVLKKNTIYYFEQCFKITDEAIKYDADLDNSIYDLNLGRQKLKINISCIVGKNGSGKSTLIELFFKVINNISSQFTKQLNTNPILPVSGLNVNLYYTLSSRMFCLTIKDKQIQITEYIYDYNKEEFTAKTNSRNFKFKDFEDFFYTIAVNYSHYALNSTFENGWVTELFHKNDAYQTPLVINPMRKGGNIDINVENDLVKQRLLSNLFMDVEDESVGIRKLTENKEAVQVHFSLKKREYDFGIISNKVFDKYLKSLMAVIWEEFKFVNQNYTTNEIVEEAELYIFHKLNKITRTYSLYSEHHNSRHNRINITKSSLVKLIRQIKDDQSHITYKIKQTINYLKYFDLIDKKDKLILDLDYYSKKLQGSYLVRHKDLETIKRIELLPPPIFKAAILIEDNHGEYSDFEKLSSGEKQQIHSVSSLLYHITNLDSITSKKLVSYKNINIILDEIELYYHPEMQRKYLSFLLNSISKLSLENIEGINICLVTHSPYILSDIPTQFTLRLDDGNPSNDNNKTFGANIHDLLANEFFMVHGTMGEWAKYKINETIRFLNYHKNLSNIKSNELTKSEINSIQKEIEDFIDSGISKESSYHYKTIQLIGEPIIRYKLEDTFSEIFSGFDQQLSAKSKIMKLAKEAGIQVNFKK